MIALAPVLLLATIALTRNSIPTVAPDGSRIAFVSETGQGSDLCVITVRGRGRRRLVHVSGDIQSADWSRDGRHVRYSVFANDSSSIYSIDPDGTNERLLATVPGRGARVSPDGTRVLYATGPWTAVTLKVSSLDGSDVRQLTDGSSVVWNACWSPDGKQIAYTGRTAGVLDLWIMNADGSSAHQVTHIVTPEGQAQVPAWSADGSRLAFQVSRQHLGHIWIIDLATGATRKLAPHTEPYADEVPSWFADGQRITFQSDRSGQMQVWVMNVDGSHQRQVTK